MEGLTDQEVAEITGQRADTVRVRLHLARPFRSQGTYEAGSAAPRTREIQSTEQARPARYNYSALFAELSDDRDEQIYVPVVGWLGSFKTPLVIMAPIPPALVGILPADALMGAFFTATQ